jgi:hypothetical protein
MGRLPLQSSPLAVARQRGVLLCQWARPCQWDFSEPAGTPTGRDAKKFFLVNAS